MTITTGGSIVTAVPDFLPDDFLEATLSTWPEPEVEAELWWQHGQATFEYPAPSLAWLRAETGRLLVDGTGHLRSDATGLWAQVVRVGTGLVVEVGDPGGEPEQVRREGAASGRAEQPVCLSGLGRVDGRPVIARVGHGWALRLTEAAAAMWVWCSEGRLRGGYVAKAVL